LELEEVFSKKAKESKSEKVSHFRNTGEVLQKSAKPDTRKELSKVASVSHDTIAKVNQYKGSSLLAMLPKVKAVVSKKTQAVIKIKVHIILKQKKTL